MTLVQTAAIKKKKKGTLSKKCIYVSLCIHTWIYLVLFFGFI